MFDSDSHNSETEARIDEACDRFEAACRRGQIPQVEVFLDQFPADDRAAALRDLLPLEVDYRYRAGQLPAVEELAERFPTVERSWLKRVIASSSQDTRTSSGPGSESDAAGPGAGAAHTGGLPPGKSSPDDDSADAATTPDSVASGNAGHPASVRNEGLAASGSESRLRASAELSGELESWLQSVIDAGVVSVDRVRALLGARRDVEPFASREALTAWLVEVGLLTNFQARRLDEAGLRELVLGEYVLLDQLGQGGMGTVFRARHRRLDRIAALKTVRQESAADPHLVQRFQREMRAIGRLQPHPHIVAAHDAGEASGTLYLVMEFVDGEDLSSLIERHGPVPVDVAVLWTIQAAEGLAYAHAQGIIHRDVKPRNLLAVRSHGSRQTAAAHTGDHPPGDGRDLKELQIKVLDLGLARLVDPSTGAAGPADIHLTSSGLVMGTAHFLAPEQGVNPRDVDARADIYSLGCTLYYLLTGGPLFPGETLAQTLLSHQISPVPSLRGVRPDVPESLDQLFQQLTAKSRDSRPGSMREVITRLQTLLDLGQLPADVPQPVQAELLHARRSAQPATVHMADSISEQSTTAGIEHSFPAGAGATSAPARPLSRRRAMLIGGVTLGGAIVGSGVLRRFGSGENGGNADSSPDRGFQFQAPGGGTLGGLSTPQPAASVRAVQNAWATRLGTQVTRSIGIGAVQLRQVLVPPGDFVLGLSEAESAVLETMPEQADGLAFLRAESAPARRARITRPFWLSRTEITVRQFRAFVDATGHRTSAESLGGWGKIDGRWVESIEFNWRHQGEQPVTDGHPAVSLSWHDATAFADWLSQLTGQTHRLPTEAEWEFACRAGSQTPWFFGTDASRLSEFAWFGGNANDMVHVADDGAIQPNSLDLLGMIGNEAEWCRDGFALYPSVSGDTLPVHDPVGPLDGAARVQRGGSFSGQAWQLCSAYRTGRPPDARQNGSFRVLCEIEN